MPAARNDETREFGDCGLCGLRCSLTAAVNGGTVLYVLHDHCVL
jgi:hypothetical protein